jgi:ribonuclease BN (tRNA processing enzyme)
VMRVFGVETIQNSQVRLRVMGCGDAFGSGGRFNTCFVVDDSHGRFAIDFGATSLIALKTAGIDPGSIDLIVLSHLHGDHFGGLPFLLLHKEFVDVQKTPLTIAGPPGFGQRLRALHESLYPGLWKDYWSFQLNLVEVEPGSAVELGERSLSTVAVKHYAGPEPSTALRITTSSRVIVYSGDTGWTDVLVPLAEASDLFLCECNDLHDQPYEGHMSYQTLSAQFERLKTRRLVLTHLGPDMLAACGNLDVESAVDGMEIHV